MGLRPRARFHSFALGGVDPVIMLTGVIPATTRILERSKLGIRDFDVIEINEAFAPVVLAWAKEFGPDMEQRQPARRRHRIGSSAGLQRRAVDVDAAQYA